ncbi:hypothetical protein EHQ53_10465 [Leptospira langatensis]|uniref:DUF3619 family protein n=1 Tax=Leptospira langatensis TaxID=2484983 RepID=A0A5F1ZTX7_9LEPT|nr:hypothetical protein [Leptospira langatensis]TGJ99013.1 hypothetical protein EHO57_16035 [Leptospira langatensis]TGL40419.1 hypothetical protein EHQ53_10465 [Leptospira langatensis]
MKNPSESELDQTVERLIQDPDFSRRIAGRIMAQVEEEHTESANLEFAWKAIAALVLLGLTAIFASYYSRSQKESTDSFSGLSNPAAELIASPVETEYVWEDTDLIIETSFTAR